MRIIRYIEFKNDDGLFMEQVKIDSSLIKHDFKFNKTYPHLYD